MMEYRRICYYSSDMHIAILNSNTDRSDFAKDWPDDFGKFSTLIKEARPDWEFSHFDMIFEQHPKDFALYDGYIVTGSPASVNADEAWIQSEIAVIQELIAMKKPVFGACFGHQLIAKALGTAVIDNPSGWEFGTVKTNVVNTPDWMQGPEDKAVKQWAMYAAHSEQVSELPKGAALLCQNEQCAIGGFAIGNTIFTTQYHPEMTDEFIEALVVELKDYVGPEVTRRASDSLSIQSDRALFANWIGDFFQAGLKGTKV